MCEEIAKLLSERMEYLEPTSSTIELVDGEKLHISNKNREGRRDLWKITNVGDMLILDGRGCHIELPYEDIDTVSWGV